MSLEIPDKPTEIRIYFHQRTTNGEVIKLLNLIDVIRIQNKVEDEILKVVLSLEASAPLSNEAKELLNEIADKGNFISFISQ